MAQRPSLLRLALVVILGLTLLTACGSDESESETTSPSEPSDEQTADGDGADSDDTDDRAATADASDDASDGTDDGNGGTDETDGETTDDDGDATEPGDAAFPRTVEDALGPVEVPAQPLRVVALDQLLLDSAFALGLEVIGYTTFADPDGPIPEIYAEPAATLATEATWVGDLSSPNLEAIALLQPDLILTSVVRHENIAEQLSQIAPTVMSDSAGGGWKDAIRLAAEATGREAVAEQAIADYEARAAAVGEAIRTGYGDPTISVVRFVDVIRLYQPVSFSGVVLADAGLSRPASQQDTENFISIISIEEIAEADADVIVYTAFDDPRATDAAAEVVAGPLWGQLEAAKAGNVHAVDDERWMTAVGLFGANAILDDLETIFEVDGS
ncbi:MAG: iron-siderophore ABC transporter substrate-binding protein [Actinomycetota bacterium]